MADLSARLLVPGDEGLVDSFLKPHTPFAFFMRSNLAKSGLVFEGKPLQADYFGAFDKGKLVGVLMHGWMGNVQLFTSDLTAIPCLVNAWRPHNAKNPRKIELFLGPHAQVARLLSQLGVGVGSLRRYGEVEGLFTLALDKLVLPPLLEKPGITVRHPKDQDLDLLTSWRHDYYVEAIGALPGEPTRNVARSEMARRIKEGDLCILEDHGEPASFCGVGGFLSDWTNVGPVWTPPEKRNRGYGRAAAAAALNILRKEGRTNAVLFAVRPEAQKAYGAIGFERIGDWLFDFLKTPLAKL